MYAIVKTGGKQYKVAVGDVVQVEKLEGKPGTEVSFPALLVVDGTDITADAEALGGVSVTGKPEASEASQLLFEVGINPCGLAKFASAMTPMVLVAPFEYWATMSPFVEICSPEN